MKRLLKATLVMILCLFSMTGCSILGSLMATKEKADIESLYNIGEGEAAVFVDNQILEEAAVIENGRYYIPFSAVRSSVDKRFYWNGSDDRLFFTNAAEQYEESVSDEEIAIVKPGEEEDQLYLSTACLEKYLNVQITEYDKCVYIDSAGSEVNIVSVKKDTEVRVLGGYKSKILTEVKEQDQVQLVTEHENWAEVRTQEGFLGYMLLNCLDMDSSQVTQIEKNVEDPEYTSIHRDYSICLAWHDMENVSGNSQFDTLFSDTKGINVVSPAWFALTGNDGSYKNLSSAGYVAKAHERGMEVWILIDDFSDQMSIGEVLNNNEVRQKLVENLVRDTLAVNADGINVDFEYISSTSGVDFIQFLRELSIRCREEGLVLSADNANPTFVKTAYDMKEQGRLLDYVVLMGYDEHWQGSEAGSVASLPYVREGILTALEMVPEEKVISGLPLYARVWAEIPEEYAESGAEIREDGNSEYERYYLESAALGIEEIQKIVDAAGVTPEWDADIGQYYVEIPLEHGKQRIWMEELESLDAKLQVVAEHSLGGVAFWRIGMDIPEVWDLVEKYIK